MSKQSHRCPICLRITWDHDDDEAKNCKSQMAQRSSNLRRANFPREVKSGQWNVNKDCVLDVKNTGFMPTFITSIVGVMIVWKIAQCYALNAMVMSPT